MILIHEDMESSGGKIFNTNSIIRGRPRLYFSQSTDLCLFGNLIFDAPVGLHPHYGEAEIEDWDGRYIAIC